MNAVVCGVIRYIKPDEKDVVNDFGTVWEELHLSRIGIQGVRGRKKSDIPQNKRWIFLSCSIRRARVPKAAP